MEESVTLISTTDNLPNLTQKFRVHYSGGKGGNPGQGGAGGVGGHGGDGGAEQRLYCSGNGSPGPSGNTGGIGAVGTNGDNGKEGDYTVGGINRRPVQPICLEIACNSQSYLVERRRETTHVQRRVRALEASVRS